MAKEKLIREWPFILWLLVPLGLLASVVLVFLWLFDIVSFVWGLLAVAAATILWGMLMDQANSRP